MYREALLSTPDIRSPVGKDTADIAVFEQYGSAIAWVAVVV